MIRKIINSCFAARTSLVRLYPDALTKNQTISTNAVYLDIWQKKRQFIVTQVPLGHSSGHFWAMVNQNKIQQILILNEPAEKEV